MKVIILPFESLSTYLDRHMEEKSNNLFLKIGLLKILKELLILVTTLDEINKNLFIF